MKRISTGVENFKRMIDKDYYYVDKTNFINNVLNEEFALYTRPRRFGKTLNMSMLYYFFSNKEKDNAYLFNSLNISKDEKAMIHQNKYPVIFLTLKDMKRSNFDDQIEKFRALISDIVDQYIELLDSKALNTRQLTLLNEYLNTTSSFSNLQDALLNMTVFLEKHYQQKVIILIDEYDVPLQSAYNNNYYEEMSEFIKNVFGSALKTNDSLEKGILTGCLRIARESIFTGLNNFNVYSIMDQVSSNQFGFGEREIQDILEYYHLSPYFNKIKEWYDGYLFGKLEIYNPWSTLKYVNKLLTTTDQYPESYWANTSGNDIIYNYIIKAQEKKNVDLHREFEALMQGKSITKVIKPELTYREINEVDNIYSFLLFTGYLKIKEYKGSGKADQIKKEYSLVIPNKEVYEIYETSFTKYFKEYTDVRKEDLFESLVEGDENKVSDLLNEILSKSISYFDNQENFYHGFLLGLLSNKTVESNRESGDGRYDLCILPATIRETAIVIECKHSTHARDLLDDANNGAKQIIERNYLEGVKDKGYLKVIGYSISFYKKQCYVVKA